MGRPCPIERAQRGGVSRYHELFRGRQYGDPNGQEGKFRSRQNLPATQEGREAGQWQAMRVGVTIRAVVTSTGTGPGRAGRNTSLTTVCKRATHTRLPA